MFEKAATVALLAILGTVGGTFIDDTWTGFTVTWPTWIFDGFYTIPENYSTAIASDWTNIIGATNRSDVMGTGYYNNCRYIVFYNTTTGDPVGIQVGFLVSDVANMSLPVDYDNFNGITRKVINGDDYYTASIWFRLNADGSRQLWIEDNWELTEIPTNTTELVNTTPWLKKNCIRTMGTHYYRINSTSTSEEFYPWSFLANEGTIIGFLFQAIGATSEAPSRKWNEDIPVIAIKFVIADAPWILLYNVWLYGVISVHSWLFEDPATITC